MAKVRFQAGFEGDILSAPEHKAAMAEAENRILGYFEDQGGDTQQFTAPFPFTTDGSGNGQGVVYQVPQGYRAYLLRLAVDFAGSNAASPVTCDLRVVAEQNTPLSLRSINNQVPSVLTDGRSQAALFQPGQHIVVVISGGPATTVISSSGQVLLVPIRKRLPADVQAPPAPVSSGSAIG